MLGCILVRAAPACLWYQFFKAGVLKWGISCGGGETDSTRSLKLGGKIKGCFLILLLRWPHQTWKGEERFYYAKNMCASTYRGIWKENTGVFHSVVTAE